MIDFVKRRAAREHERGLALEREGKLDQAAEHFARAVEIDPEHVEARVALGCHLARQGRPADAVEEFQVAIAVGDYPAAFFHLGHTLIEEGQYEPGISALRECLYRAPDYAAAQYEIGYAYFAQEEYDVAATELHRAGQMQANWQTLQLLGECYLQLGELSEARRVMLRAQAAASNARDAATTQSRLVALDRYAEFPGQDLLGIKDRVYADHGVIVLGSAQDNGLAVPNYVFYNFDYLDLAVTLSRFDALCRTLDWPVRAVAAVDSTSLPLAIVLARRLAVPLQRELVLLRPGWTVLVQAVTDDQALQAALERYGSQILTFCLGVQVHANPLPDVIGVVTPVPNSVPWYCVSEAGRLRVDDYFGRPSLVTGEPFVDARPAETIASDIEAALDAAADKGDCAGQIAYYQIIHRRLRFGPS